MPQLADTMVTLHILHCLPAMWRHSWPVGCTLWEACCTLGGMLHTGRHAAHWEACCTLGGMLHTLHTESLTSCRSGAARWLRC